MTSLSPMLCDCHAHLADERIFSERHALLADCREHGLVGVLANAAQWAEWPRILQLCQEEEGVLGALGIHPFWPEQWSKETEAALLQILSDPKQRKFIRAVGEIGLDYWNGRGNAPLQQAVFARQLEIAVQYDLPVSLHNRKSWEDFFGIVRDLRIDGLRGFCHNFTAGTDLARRVLDLGLHLSFCSPVTNPEASRCRASAAYAPANRILTETDCPDLPAKAVVMAAGDSAPQSRPWHVSLVLDSLAEIRQTTPDILAQTVHSTWQELFRD